VTFNISTRLNVPVPCLRVKHTASVEDSCLPFLGDTEVTELGFTHYWGILIAQLLQWDTFLPSFPEF
jgi:hypothetical protein